MGPLHWLEKNLILKLALGFFSGDCAIEKGPGSFSTAELHGFCFTQRVILAISPWQIHSQKISSVISDRHDIIGLNMPLGKMESVMG